MFNQKKILAFVLLLAVTAPLLFFAGFLIKQKLVQYEMEERLENTFLQTITVDQSNIQWVKKNKEAIINGKLFDVKYIDITGKKVTLSGLFDEDENKLKKYFINIMQREKNDPSPLQHFILKIFSGFVYSNNPAATIASFSQKTEIIYRFYDEAVVGQNLSVNNPPPNI